MRCVGVLLLAITSVALVIPNATAKEVCVTVKVVEWYMGQARTRLVEKCHTVEDPATESKTDPNGATPIESNITCRAPVLSVDGTDYEVMECGDLRGGAGTTPGSHILTMSQILSAFHDTAIPRAEVMIQPPGGKTLVNFDTLYRTKADAFTRSFRLLGRRIQLKIRPTSYTWVTGDGEKFSTTDPGIAYESGRPMSDYISHQYELTAQALHPRVDVTWAASYRVADGRWLPVTGTVTTTGRESTLKVVEARSVLLGGY